MRNIIFLTVVFTVASAHTAEISLSEKAIQIFSKRLTKVTDSIEVNGLSCVIANNSAGYDKFCSGNVVGTDSSQIFTNSEEYAVFNKIINHVRARRSPTIGYLYEPVSIFCLRRSQTCVGILFRQTMAGAPEVLWNLSKRFGGDHARYDLVDLTCTVVSHKPHAMAEGRCRARVGEALKLVEFSESESKDLIYLLQQVGAEPAVNDSSRLDPADVRCDPRSKMCLLDLKREF